MDPSRVITERLVLREPSAADLGAVFDVHGDPATNRYNPAGAHRTMVQSRHTLDGWLVHWRDHRFGYWTLALRSSPESVIGFGGVMCKDIGDRTRPNLYFRLRPSAWGRGYATEMARAARTLAFEDLGFEEIVARVRPHNGPSIRTLERLGMVHVEDVSDAHGVSRLYVLRRRPPA